MKILFADDQVKGDYSYELSLLTKYLENIELAVYHYKDDEELAERMQEVDALVTCFMPVSAEVIRKSKRLKVISVDATGYGNVDVEEAKKNGVALCTLGEYCTEEVADHTLALILALERDIKEYILAVDKDKEYSFHRAVAKHKLSRQRLAIFGYGKIGRAVARRGKAFGYDIVAVTRNSQQIGMVETDGTKYVSVEEALETADVISNHMNQTPENENYFDMDKFERMKRTAMFINVGRGVCVNEDDLVRALDNKIIAKAALDVLRDTRPDLHIHPLVGRENVIITPHSAFYSTEVIEFLEKASVMNAIYYLTGQDNNISCRIC